MSNFVDNRSTTFVTAYLNLYDDKPFDKRTLEWRLSKFCDIVKTGIALCIYVSIEYVSIMNEIANEYPNVKIMEVVNLKDTWVSKVCAENTFTLPMSRNSIKDSDAYLICMNSKLDFMNDAIEKNPWSSTHFAWIDFSITYCFHHIPRSMEHLHFYSKCKFNDKFLTIPGCWGKWNAERHQHHLDNIHWRFCGGFFIGDKDSIVEMYRLHRAHFDRFLKENGKLLWEVNFWAWLEYVCPEWKPTWFCADHNDSMICISPDFIATKMENKQMIKMEYPPIEHFQPTSSSYLCYQGKHLLNTRFVNYWLNDKCYYLFSDGSRTIKNKNILTRLEENAVEGFTSISHSEMDETTVNLESFTPNDGKMTSVGLEDLRLYEFGGKMKFIATNINYSPSGRNRMIVGDYCPDTATYSDCRLIIPPNPDSWCEKNWIPITGYGKIDAGVESESDPLGVVDEELFIYKWSPMEIGKINDKNQLEIVRTYNTISPWFNRVRGSTIFTESKTNPNTLIGIVHFSEEGAPRHYYHMLVSLEKGTLKPLKYSTPFYFENIGVEFCIGMAERMDEYIFWISRMDRDATKIVISKNEVPLDFDCIYE